MESHGRPHTYERLWTRVHGRPTNSAYMHVHSYRRRTDTQVDSAGHDLYKSIVTLFGKNTPLTRALSPVEVKGFEPSASALRKSGSQCFDQVLSEGSPGSTVAIPSGHLTIHPLSSR